MYVPLVPLHLVITIGPFSNWGTDFVTYTPTSTNGHDYIIFIVDYFTKWAKVFHIFKLDGQIVALFLFNQVISRFSVPHTIVRDYFSHFQNYMMFELTNMLGFHQDHLFSYYLQDNGQVEFVNDVLKTMI